MHGAGGLGKSRLLHDVAADLLDTGVVDTVYCATRGISQPSDWYVGIQPDASALVLVDDPTSAAFVELFWDSLRDRARGWKVLISARTPLDPVVMLTSTRYQLLAQPLELAPLQLGCNHVLIALETSRRR